MYTLGQISEWLNAELHGDPSSSIHALAYDSRRITQAKGVVFFALRTSSGDGHAYLKQLKQREVTAVVVDHFIEDLEIDQLVVSNTLEALQTLVAHHRKRFNIPVIAITGSNGKTIVKEWLYHLLKDKFSILKSPKSFNSQLGVPLSLWPLNEHHDLAIIEAGISKKGEMVRLQNVIHPTHGVFTHLGDAHGQNFSDKNEKLQEKLKLFENCNRVYAHQVYGLDQFIKKPNALINWGESQDCELQLIGSVVEFGRTKISAEYKGEGFQFSISFTDTASLENALTVATVALDFGISTSELADKMMTLPTVDMRLQQVDGINRNTLFLDHYNSDLQSVEIALNFMTQQLSSNKRIVIMSDLLETELQGEQLYKRVSELLVNAKVDEFIGIGDDLKKYAELFKNSSSFYSSVTAFLNTYPLYNIYDSNLLIKGARSFQFEQITDALSKKSHQTVLEVNMSRLQANLNAHKSAIGHHTKLMAMVKAFSYGSGGHQLAKLLEYNQVDYLGVAYVDEAVELRRSGIHTPIMILNPDLTSIDDLIDNQLEPVLFSKSNLEQLRSIRSNNILKVHIEIDTGMHRLGFNVKEAIEFITELKHYENIKVASVFSHLSSADEESKDHITNKQITDFKEGSELIEKELGYAVLKHIGNTAAIERHPDSKFDMVRLGIGLYGVGMNSEFKGKLQAVGTFKSYIAQIKQVAKGEGIGYGSLDAVNENRKIAVVAVGYADGYDRRFSRGVGSFFINGKAAPVVGNVCMDMTMCDVSHIDCSEGDEVVIFGDQPNVESLAKQIGTIPYEILTNVSERVTRIYFQE